VKSPAVYILASKPRGVLYIGVTSNLVVRVAQHKSNVVDGFSKKYGTHLLVYFEQFDDMYSAISREKQLKSWRREWKIQLVESVNPRWRDLYSEIVV